MAYFSLNSEDSDEPPPPDEEEEGDFFSEDLEELVTEGLFGAEGLESEKGQLPLDEEEEEEYFFGALYADSESKANMPYAKDYCMEEAGLAETYASGSEDLAVNDDPVNQVNDSDDDPLITWKRLCQERDLDAIRADAAMYHSLQRSGNPCSW